ncbi:hypothetical protein ASD54_12260 [Rhizobium sp. Root149]|uniref:hypothetical protein n=1 Tax=Rhizobium sp. Root149 TaxID=1736473 RepID=UPI000713D1F4|nr:hypothetical protein [Rhizobium sp. Root149]KQZ49705.1 hypothetical protein ASD54_12260 [Rhizobium sp. Root149]
MKRLVFGAPAKGQETDWIIQSLRKIEQATFEDIEQTFDALTITGSFTETRTINPSTATTAELAAFVATFVTDIKKRGQNRNPSEV